MQTRNHFLNYITKAQNIIETLDVNDNKLGDLKTKIEQAELIIPVVGGFSAGKSTLINSFLGSEILPTAVTPETALATELRYGDKDYIEAVNGLGGVERYEITDFYKLKDNAQNFKNLRVYLNNENLKAIEPLVLVDMPGFDAPIESHNQAILSYLERGVYFVFLTSVEDGNLTLSMKREIENLQRIGKGFSFCISKTNLRAPNDVQAVKDKIAEQLEDDFDYVHDVTLLDMDGGNNLKNIVKTINSEKLFHSLFIEELRDNYASLIQSFNVKISTFKGGKKEIDDAITELQNSINRLVMEKEDALAQVEQRYATNSVSSIADRVSRSLLQRKEQLIELALHNQTAFSLEVNDLVKNSLLDEVQRRFQDIGNNIIHDFSNHLKINLTENNTIINSDVIERIRSNSEILLNRAHNSLLSRSERMNDKVNDETQQVTVLYRTVATILGLTTSVVAPALEIIIIFLPDIIRFFTKETQERKAREHIEQQLLNKIIPDISAKIRETLPEKFNAQISVLIRQISEQFEQQLQQKRDEIQMAEAQKIAKSTELESLIAQLENGKQQLNVLANKMLFS